MGASLRLFPSSEFLTPSVIPRGTQSLNPQPWSQSLWNSGKGSERHTGHHLQSLGSRTEAHWASCWVSRVPGKTAPFSTGLGASFPSSCQSCEGCVDASPAERQPLLPFLSFCCKAAFRKSNPETVQSARHWGIDTLCSHTPFALVSSQGSQEDRLGIEQGIVLLVDQWVPRHLSRS